MAKPIQEQLGESIIKAIHAFAEADMVTSHEIEATYLFHISDPKFRTSLAETLFGARWIYKLGLVLLVENEKQMAHVRAQLIDYCSVCEGVLSDMIFHGVINNHFNGQCFRFHDFKKLNHPLDWSAAKRQKTIGTRSFAWLLAVAHEEKIITKLLYDSLDWLRKERNAVHLRARSFHAYLDKSHSAFHHMRDLFKQTQVWKHQHP